MKSINVGLVGASARGGWARDSHVPAIAATEGLELAAVASSSRASVDAAARAFGAPVGFDDAFAMIRDPGVDLIAISVKVPAHYDLVRAALAARKHVLCEWPLGRDVGESVELARLARDAGVHAAIGLQARANPVARRAREIVASGSLGRVFGARMYSTTAAFGDVVAASMLYAEDGANGVSLPTIQGAHSIDLAIAIVGELRDVTASLATQYPTIAAGDDGAPRERTTRDHVLAHARLVDGGTLAIEVVGGRPVDDTPFRFEITCERATVCIVGGATRGFQSGELRLLVDGRPVTVDDAATHHLPATAVNVALTYAMLRDDVLHDTWHAPDFDHAVRLARLLDDVTTSSATGARIEAGDWPRSTSSYRAHADRM